MNRLFLRIKLQVPPSNHFLHHSLLGFAWNVPGVFKKSPGFQQGTYGYVESAFAFTAIFDACLK